MGKVTKTREYMGKVHKTKVHVKRHMVMLKCPVYHRFEDLGVVT